MRFWATVLLTVSLAGAWWARAEPTAEALPSFQRLVDETPDHGTLAPPPGRYAGPVYIDRPMEIDGRGQVTIDAGGKGSVVVLDTDGATLRGLRLVGSGSSHNDIDSAVQVRGNFNVVKDNEIDDCLFGIDLQQSSNNIVRRNRIRSKSVELGQRGDAVRLWYSFNNQITDNEITDSRDMVVWYSRDNLIARNRANGGRYALHFMYAQYNKVEDNRYWDNSVGIFLMYSDGVEVRNNYIARATGPTGIGIGFKETSDVVIEGNQVLYNAVGLYLDVSPYQPDTTNRVSDNLIAFNGVAVRFLNDWAGNEFRANRFKGNITEVVVEGGDTANRNLWEGNYWDLYEGFDRDADGVGDTPYELYRYADRIWMDVPSAQFFKGSPMLEVLDFLERLAPFTDPHLLVRDSRPYLTAEAARREWPAASPEVELEEGAVPEQPSAYDLLRRSLGRE